MKIYKNRFAVLRLRIKGFTLIELLVTLAIVAILAAVGTPSLKSFIDNNKVKAETQRISGIFSRSRNEALTQNRSVIVYGSIVDDALDLDVYTDSLNGVVTYQVGETYILRSKGSAKNLDYGFTDAIADNAVRFDNKGRLREGDLSVFLTICDEKNDYGRSIAINRIGRVSVSKLDDPQNDCL